jgi:glyoxylase-like metal-dependent hydrolase (beta-lactamase superfamily II)
MMKTILKSMTAAMGAAVVLAAVGPAQEWDSVFRFEKIGEGVYASLTRDEVNPSAYANAVFVVGSGGALMVDAHHAPDAAARSLAEFRAHVDVPVRWLVLTHHHGDHVWGASAVREAFPGVEILAHPATRDSLVIAGERHLAAEVERVSGIVDRIRAAFDTDEIPEGETERYRAALTRYERQLEGLATIEVVPPTAVVAGERRLDLGGREAVVIHAGAAHTAGDLVVWVPDVGFLAAGDLLEEAPLWLEGAEVRGWAAALDRLNGLGATRVLPSHGRKRDDAALLHAHAGFLGDAVRALDSGEPTDSAGLVAVLEEHRVPLIPLGVEGEQFEAYVAAVRKGILGN